MKQKLSRKQINNITFDGNTSSFLQVMLMIMGLLFILPGLIKHIISFFLLEQEILEFYEDLPIELSDIIQTFPIWIGIFLLVFNYVFFKLIGSVHTKIPGVISTKKLAKEIIYSGRKLKTKMVGKQQNFHATNKDVPSTLYGFTSDEFNEAYFTTMNDELILDSELYVYWNAKYPQLVIPAIFLD